MKYVKKPSWTITSSFLKPDKNNSTQQKPPLYGNTGAASRLQKTN